MSRSPSVLFESLENRQLMDATLPYRPAPIASFGTAVEMLNEMSFSHDHHSGMVVTVGTLGSPKKGLGVPSLIGNWKGTVTVDLGEFSTTGDFTLQITRQTKTSLTGTANIDGQVYKGTSRLRWSGRNFTITYSSGEFSLTMKGTINAAGNQINTTATFGNGHIVGHMTAKRTK